ILLLFDGWGFFFQAEDGIRDYKVTGVQTCALPIFFCGDGCLMEGVSSEACSLAGHLKLDNLCLLYDDNSITIDGRTTLAFTEDVAARFAAYHWNVLRVSDANDTVQVAKAIESAKATKGKPTIILVKSIIGYGAPKRQDTAD